MKTRKKKLFKSDSQAREKFNLLRNHTLKLEGKKEIHGIKNQDFSQKKIFHICF